MTYSSKHPQQNTPLNTDAAGQMFGGIARPYRPDDMGSDHKLSMAAQREHLSILQNRLAALTPDDSVDHFYKLSSALCATRKCYNETADRHVKNAELDAAASQARPKPLSQAERDRKIADICELVNGLTPEDYDWEKIKRLAAENPDRFAPLKKDGGHEL